MKGVFQTRLIHWKNQMFGLLFWLLFPLIATITVIFIVNTLQEDTRIPIGVVLEEKTELAEQLYESIHSTSFVNAYLLSEREALNKLQKHELDSVFVVRKGYEQNIRNNNRNRLIKGYQSDLSFAYTAVSEMIISFVQQDAGRSKAAYVIKELSETYNVQDQPTWDEIIENSKIIESEQNLLQTTFTFIKADQNFDVREVKLLKPWSLWALFALLATFLLFDWVIKENCTKIIPRFSYTCISFKSYLLKNTLIYTFLLFSVDLLTMIVFHVLYKEDITFSFVSTLLFYRVLINLGAFILALCVKNTYLFYSTGLTITLLGALTSGTLLPISGLITWYPWLTWLHPLHAFLSGHIFNVWLVLCICFVLVWYIRKEGPYAAS